MSQDLAEAGPSSTSAQWRSFSCTLLLVVTLATGLLYLFILIIDPFDNFPLSPDWTRIQVFGSFRFYKPALARRPEYDGIVLGSSSIMLLNPARLNEAFDARFATLAMPAASPYEQRRLLALYQRHHSDPRYIIMGIDHYWCEGQPLPKQMGANVGQPMPDWLYDENRWNDWPGLNSQVLKYARRQLEALMKPREAGAHDGYYEFTTKDYGVYDLDRARQYIYGDQTPLPRPEQFEEILTDTYDEQGGPFPEIDRLADSLASLPPGTAKLVVFPPYHWYRVLKMDSEYQHRLAECKARVAKIGEQLENFYVLDFMRLSPITLEDSHYWDHDHYNTAIAQALENYIADAVLKGRRQDDYFTYLWPLHSL